MRSTTECPHCGAELEPIVTVIGDREFSCGTMPCTCPEAMREQRMAKDAEAAAKEAERAAAFGRKAARAGIPKRYASAEHPDAAAMADSVERGRGFYIVGGNGTGKTHLAYAVGLECLRRGIDVRAVTAPRLLEAMRSRSAEDAELAAKASTCGLLILDDLGKQSSATPFACDRLWDIIDTRWTGVRPIIVTSNFERSEIGRRIPEGGVGIAVASRLAGMTDVVRLDGADRRVANG